MLYSDDPLMLVKFDSILFLYLHRVPNDDTNLNIQIKEDPKFNEEVENYFSKDEGKHNGENKNTRNKKHDRKFTDMNTDYMNLVRRNRNDRNDKVK